LAGAGPELPPLAPGVPPLPPRAEVTPGKVKGLEEALGRWGIVKFRSGASIKRLEDGRLEVARSPGPVLRAERVYLARQIEDAYDYALNGSPDAEREAAQRKRVRPAYYRERSIPKPHPEWDECPF
jgi:hypothetical protein